MPNGQHQQDQFYGEPIPIYNFKKGLWTVSPEMLIPKGASPYLKNVWYDEKNALSKMPGTELLLTETNNQFSSGQCQNLFVYYTPAGQQILIYQGLDSAGTTMSLFSLLSQSSYPANVAMTDITPSSGLTLYKKCHFANYRGKLYLANGTDNLKQWNGSEWIEYHASSWEPHDERFKYICVFDDCLFQAWSAPNPNRIIFTAQNWCNFAHYYNPNQSGYWRDFPTTEGDYITGISVSPKGSLLIWKGRSLHEVIGSPVNDTDSTQPISIGRGTIDISSVQVLGDIVIFAAGDMLYMLGNRDVMVSAEDQKLQTEANIKPLTTEIRNFWKDNFTLPDPNKIKEKTWAGYGNWCATLTFVNGTDASNFKADDVGIEVDDTITGGTSGETAKVVYVDLTSGTWGAGTAAGILYLTRVSGTFDEAGEDISIGTTKFAETADPVAYTAGWVTPYSQINTPSVTTNPDVINSGLPKTGLVERHFVSTTAHQTTQDGWVSLRGETGYGEDQYFSQQFELDDATIDKSICSGVLLYFKETGDVSGDTIKVYITSENDDDKPDFNNVYAEGKLSGNFLHGIEELSFDAGESEIYVGETINGATSGATGIVHQIVITSGSWTGNDTAGHLYIKGVTGTWQDDEDIRVVTTKHAVTDTGGTADSSPISTGCWVFCEMDYWDKPQNMYDGDLTAKNEVHIAIKVTGDSDAAYIQWGYNSAGEAYGDGMMVNSDSENPSGQADLDYAFEIYGRHFFGGYDVEITTTAFQADSDLVNWGSVYAVLDEAVILDSDYTRNTKLTKVEYEVLSEDTGWGSWTETTNGGAITGTNRWLKLRFTFARSTGNAMVDMDSFTLRSVRVSYNVQDLTEKLISSAIWEDRYLLTCKMSDPGIVGDCLYFTGTDEDDCDYLEIPDSATLDPGTSDFAFVFDIKCDNDDQVEIKPFMINKQSQYLTDDNTKGIWGLSWAKGSGAGTLYVELGQPDNSSVTFSSNPNTADLGDGVWHTVVVSYDRNGNLNIYVDGVDKSGDSKNLIPYAAWDVTSNKSMYLGINQPLVGLYRWLYIGYLDNIQFYKRTIGATEALWLYTNTGEIYSSTNLQMHLKMNEGEGETTYDDTTNNNDGELGGSSHTEARKPSWAWR